MYYNFELGKKGEDIAKRFLQEKGYVIFQSNYKKHRVGEIDIIARDKQANEIVFFEVKTRKSNNYGEPSESVNYHKLEKITKTATHYLYEHNLEDTPCRIDVIEVIANFGKWKVNHIKDAVDG